MSGNKKPFGVPYQREVKAYAVSEGVAGYELLVLDALLGCCNGDSGQSRPGRAHIKERAGIKSDRTLDKHLKALRDRQIILPIAYLNGGRGRTTVYGFCLPAWSGQKRQKTPASAAVEREGVDVQNPRKVYTKPPQDVQKTPANHADPTEGTERTEDAAGPSRPEVDKVPERQPSARTDALTPVSKWDAISILSRHGVSATVSQITAGMKSSDLAQLGYAVG